MPAMTEHHAMKGRTRRGPAPYASPRTLDEPGQLRGLAPSRVAAGLSQRELADASGVSVGAIRHYESGARRPGPVNVIALAMTLGVDPDALYGHQRRKEGL